MCKSKLGGILCVTNRSLCRRPFEEQMDIVCALHPRAVILREKDLAESDYEELARRILLICDRHHVPLIPHFYPEAARALGLRRIHLPLWKLREVTGNGAAYPDDIKGCDTSSRNGKYIFPSNSGGGKPDYPLNRESGTDSTSNRNTESAISSNRWKGSTQYLKNVFDVIGCSVHSVEEAREAVRLGATYLSAGHIFETDCKKGLPPRGLDFLREVCASVPVPVYAIGGIHLDPEQLTLVQSCEAAGACIMSGLMTI